MFERVEGGEEAGVGVRGCGSHGGDAGVVRRGEVVVLGDVRAPMGAESVDGEAGGSVARGGDGEREGSASAGEGGDESVRLDGGE